MKVIWTHEALKRLQGVKKYISKDNPDRASQFIQLIIDRAEIIPLNPHLGRIVPELSNPEIRILIYMNYRIVYRKSKKSIEILTVFKAHMQLRLQEMND